MKYLLFIIFTCSVFTAFTQKDNKSYIQVKYTYIVENVQSENQLQKLESDFRTIKGVDNIKYYYKPEKQRAQYIIYTTQQVRQLEGDKEFSINDLKAAVIKNELTPNEFKEEIIK